MKGRPVLFLAGVAVAGIAIAVPRMNHASTATAFMGDSITQGWVFPRKNLGVYGQTTSQMVQRFSAQVGSAGVSRVVILGGTNDVLLGINEQVTLANLGRMLDMSEAMKVSPVLGELPPIYAEHGRYAMAVRRLNVAIRQLGEQRHVPVVDYYDALAGHPETSSDGVHLKRRGYLMMEWALLRTEARL